MLPKDKGSTTDLLVEFHVEDSLQLGASDGDGFPPVLGSGSQDCVCGYSSEVEPTPPISGLISGVSNQYHSLNTFICPGLLQGFVTRGRRVLFCLTSKVCYPRASIRFWWRASAALSCACVIGFLATLRQDGDSMYCAYALVLWCVASGGGMLLYEYVEIAVFL